MNEHSAVFQLIGNGLVIWAALVGTASVIVHLRVFDPHSTMSRHLLVYMAAIALVLDLGVVRLAAGDSNWFQLLRLVAFVAVVLSMTQRLWLQVQAQRTTARTHIPAPDRTPEPPR